MIKLHFESPLVITAPPMIIRSFGFSVIFRPMMNSIIPSVKKAYGKIAVRSRFYDQRSGIQTKCEVGIGSVVLLSSFEGRKVNRSMVF